jgi:TatD DNase family protein
MSSRSPFYIDAHSHLTDPRSREHLGSWLQKARELNIQEFIQGGVDPQEWQRQKELAQIHQGIHCCFGLHPYFVAAHTIAENEQALDQLAREMKHAVALGELGLDFRDQFLGDNPEEERAKQIYFLEQQLELGAFSNKPFVFHFVQAFEESVRVLELFDGPLRGIVHGFNGSFEKAQAYLDLGLTISVGGPLARAKNQKLKEAVKKIPMESLVIETDSPDQSSDAFKGHLNPPESLWTVAQTVSELKGLSTEEVLDRSSQNLRKLFSL